MLLSMPILNWFGQTFWSYISGPILTKYMIPHQISTNPTTSNLKISTNSNAYISVNSLLILVKFWILNLMTNPSKVYDMELNFNHSKSQPLIMLLSQSIFIWFVSNFVFYIGGPILTKYLIWNKVGSWNNVGSWNEVGNWN